MFASPLRRFGLPAIMLSAGLAACAGSTTTGAYVPPAVALARQAPAAQSAQSSGSGVSPGVKPEELKDLYVTDYLDNAVKILKNGSYRDAGAITAGVNWPTGIFLDKRGNLYVANTFGASVTEYRPHATTPAFTYSANMVNPFMLAVDAHGNVFESDNNGSYGQINEYFQGINATVASCTPGQNSGGNAGVYGVAIDAKGDVFVDYRLPGGVTGTLAEYPGGLQRCSQTTFPLTVSGPAGIAIDANGNILLAEAQGGVVDVIAPPYSSITRTIGSGFSAPVDVKLSKDNTTAFVADGQNNTVTMVNYQTGSNVTVLGAQNGLSNVNGAVDGPNAIY